LLRCKHAPAVRDRSPAVRGACRLTQHFCLRERDIEASEQAHERLIAEVVLYRVFRSAQVSTAAGRSSISVYRNSIPDNAEVTAVQKSVPKAFYRSAASITASRWVPLPSWTRVASFDHLVGEREHGLRTIGRSPNSRESWTNWTNTSTRR
jgi:hypothetical protein